LKVLFTFLLSLGVSLLIIPLVIRLARRCDCIDLPGKRSMHALPTPRWGGLAFAIGIIPVFFFLHIDRQVLSFIIAADYELMLRFLEKHRISSYYIDYVLVRGVSNRSFNNILRKSYEDYQAWKVNGLHGGLQAVFLKNISKLPQLLAYFKHSPLPISRHAQNG
jgi:hypothetical protein